MGERKNPWSSLPLLESFIHQARFKRYHLSLITVSILSLVYLGKLDNVGRVFRGALNGSSETCNPYTSLGSLEVSSEPHNNRWIPFDPTCYAPALLASFFKANWEHDLPKSTISLGDGFTKAEVGPDGRDWIDMEWARGRTVLSGGDSIARMALQDFCAMTGGLDEVVDPGHRWWPQTDPEYLVIKQTEGDHNAHICYVEALDFLIIHVHTFGTDDYDFYAKKEAQASGPYRYEERFEFLGKGTIAIVRQEGRLHAPDLILLHSGLWDAMRWLREDLEAGRDTTLPISQERLTTYISRLRSIDQAATLTYPYAHRSWSALHYPIAQEASTWFFEGVSPKGQRPKQKLNRMNQMNSAMRYALEDVVRNDRRADFFNWGEVIKGTENFMRDDLHPNTFPAYYVWADMMLFELRRKVSS